MTGSETDGGVQRCPVCGDGMYIDEEWRLRAGLEVGEPATEGDYVHARCYEGGETRTTETTQQ